MQARSIDHAIGFDDGKDELGLEYLLLVDTSGVCTYSDETVSHECSNDGQCIRSPNGNCQQKA